MTEPFDVISLPGVFDLEGEPEIRVMADGALEVVFNFMPPSWAEDDPDSFDDFDEQLASATASLSSGTIERSSASNARTATRWKRSDAS